MTQMTESEAAILAVSQMFTQAKTDMTELEANLWATEIERLGCFSLISFAKFWISGEAGVLRAPRIQDFRRYADPSSLNEELAFNTLYLKVGSCGPYSDPDFDDARLHAAVLELGGWVQVCQEIPSIGDDFRYKRYKDRFSTAWENAQAQCVQGKLSASVKALGLCSLPSQAALRAIAFKPAAQDEHDFGHISQLNLQESSL